MRCGRSVCWAWLRSERYASEQEHSLYRDDLNRLAAERKVRIQAFHSQGDLVRLGQGLTSRTPAILLFLGGTPELAQFTQGLERQSRQRYVVAMADVNQCVRQSVWLGRDVFVTER